MLEGVGMLDGQTVGQAVEASPIICSVATVFALICARLFKRGPVEAAMRQVTG